MRGQNASRAAACAKESGITIVHVQTPAGRASGASRSWNLGIQHVEEHYAHHGASLEQAWIAILGERNPRKCNGQPQMHKTYAIPLLNIAQQPENVLVQSAVTRVRFRMAKNASATADVFHYEFLNRRR